MYISTILYFKKQFINSYTNKAPSTVIGGATKINFDAKIAS